MQQYEQQLHQPESSICNLDTALASFHHLLNQNLIFSMLAFPLIALVVVRARLKDHQFFFLKPQQL